jgi:hypothetical protein
MLKRKPTTDYNPDGEALPSEPEPQDCNISTPEEIKNRKVFKAKRPTAPTKSGFILKSTLVPSVVEAELLKESKATVVDFLSIPDEEVKDFSPEKTKQNVSADLSGKNSKNEGEKIEGKISEIKGKTDENNTEIIRKEKETISNNGGFSGSTLGKTVNPFSSILQKINDKKAEELVNSFITSAAAKNETISAPKTEFLASSKKSELERLVVVEGQASINHVPRGEGFIELAQGTVDKRSILSILIRNSIKNVIYQASLSKNSDFRECENCELLEDEADSIEIEIDTFRKVGEKVVKDVLRIGIKKRDQQILKNALLKYKSEDNKSARNG